MSGHRFPGSRSSVSCCLLVRARTLAVSSHSSYNCSIKPGISGCYCRQGNSVDKCYENLRNPTWKVIWRSAWRRNVPHINLLLIPLAWCLKQLTHCMIFISNYRVYLLTNTCSGTCFCVAVVLALSTCSTSVSLDRTLEISCTTLYPLCFLAAVQVFAKVGASSVDSKKSLKTLLAVSPQVPSTGSCSL